MATRCTRFGPSVEGRPRVGSEGVACDGWLLDEISRAGHSVLTNKVEKPYKHSP